MAPPDTESPAPSGRSMEQPYVSPEHGVGARSGTSDGRTRAAMEFAEMIVDTVREGLLVLDLDLRVEAANESFYRMFGGDREETEGRIVFELGNGAWDLPELRDLLERVLPERHSFNDFKVEHSFEGIGRRVLRLNARQLNHHQMVLLAIEDVTDREHAGEALRLSEARYQALLHSVDQGYCVLEMMQDAEGAFVDYRFLEANEAFEKHTGLVDVVGRTVRELIPGVEDYWIELYGRVAATGEPMRFKQQSAAMGRWFDVYASRIEGADSRQVALLFSDITEQVAVEEARRESERRYQELFAQAPAFIAVLREPDLRFEFVNPAYMDLVGDRDLLGKPLREAFPEIEGQGLFEILDSVYESGEPFTAVDRPVLVDRTRTGVSEQRFVDFVYQPIREPDGSVSGIIALGVDTTERVQTREKLDEANQELDRANKELEQRVESRTQQVRGLAAKLSVVEQEERRRIAYLLHDDLQQQLFGTSLALSILAEVDSPEDRGQLLQQARGTLEHAMAQARTLATELSPAVLDTDRLSDVLQWLARRKQELFGMEVEVEGDADIADPALRTLLYHLVREVLFNVAKHAETNRATIAVEEADGQVVITISDEGVGFDPEALDAGEAEGFGLTNIRERLELVGGRFEVASVPGEGTRITLRLPRHLGPAA